MCLMGSVWVHSQEYCGVGLWVVHQRGGNRPFKCGWYKDEADAIRLRDTLNRAWAERKEQPQGEAHHWLLEKADRDHNPVSGVSSSGREPLPGVVSGPPTT